MRLLWQSSTPITRYPAYNAAILAHAAHVLGPDVEVRVGGTVRPTFGRYTRANFFLKSRDILDSAMRAAEDGVDGIAIGCFLDPLLHELREWLDIPVMGLAETGMHTACLLGRRFGVLSHSEMLNIKVYDDLVQRYGLQSRFAGMRSVDLSMDRLETAMQHDPAEAIALVREAAGQLVAQGAEVIVPGCGLLNLFCLKSGLARIDGATMLDVTGALLKTTESMVVLRRVSGTAVSRVGYYAGPEPVDLQKTLSAFAADAASREAR
jgi:Asp/Glu/hydantoin racemase